MLTHFGTLQYLHTEITCYVCSTLLSLFTSKHVIEHKHTLFGVVRRYIFVDGLSRKPNANYKLVWYLFREGDKFINVILCAQPCGTLPVLNSSIKFLAIICSNLCIIAVFYLPEFNWLYIICKQKHLFWAACNLFFSFWCINGCTDI